MSFIGSLAPSLSSAPPSISSNPEIQEKDKKSAEINVKEIFSKEFLITVDAHKRKIELFEDMQTQGVEIDTKTYSTVMKAYTAFGSFDKVTQLFNKILEKKIKVDTEIYTTVIAAYVERGDLHAYNGRHAEMEQDFTQAITLFNKAQKKGLSAHLKMYHYIMYVHLQLNKFEVVLYLIPYLLKNGLIPNETTYNYVAKACTLLIKIKKYSLLIIRQLKLNPIMLFELAKALAWEAPDFFSNSKTIRYFCKNEKNKVEIACLIAAKHPQKIAESINKYEIKSSDDLFKIGQIMASIDDFRVFEFVRQIPVDLITYSRPSPALAALRQEIINRNLRTELRCFAAYQILAQVNGLTARQHLVLIPYLKQIIKNNHVAVRNVQLRLLFLLRNALEENEKEYLKLPPILLPTFLHLKRLQLEILKADWDVAYQAFRKIKALNSIDTERLNDFFISLVDNKKLTPLEKGALLRHVSIHEDVLNQRSVLALILSIDQEAFIQEALKECTATKGLDLHETLEKIVLKSLALQEDSEFREQYAATIAKSRNPAALYIYIAQLQFLQEDEQKELFTIVQSLVKSILNNSYEQQRMKTKHLEIVFKDNPQGIKKWQEHEKFRLDEILNTQRSPEEVINVNILKERFKKEIYAKSGQLSLVFNYLTAASAEGTKKISDNLAARLKAAIKTKSGETFNPKAPTAETFWMKLEFGIMNMFKALDRCSRTDEQIAAIRNVKPYVEAILGSDCQLLKDLENLMKFVQLSSYTVENTGAWDDLLLIGTEVKSCQGIYHDHNYNKCLLGYIMDGKNRAVVIKDREGKIVARSIIRLLWDQEKQVPVLYREEFRFNPQAPKEALAAIGAMCVRRAKALNVDVVSSFPVKFHVNNSRAVIPERNDRTYAADLRSFGCPAPYEYVDAAVLGITHGDYTIASAWICRGVL